MRAVAGPIRICETMRIHAYVLVKRTYAASVHVDPLHAVHGLGRAGFRVERDEPVSTRSPSFPVADDVGLESVSANAKELATVN